jgi:hypothetical protein
MYNKLEIVFDPEKDKQNQIKQEVKRYAQT